MRMSWFKVNNFRCIDALEINLYDYTTLIGANNTGKSSYLKALEIFLSQSSPSADDWRNGHESEPIKFEAEFVDLADWESRKPGISPHVNDGKINLRFSYEPPGEDGKIGKPKIESLKRRIEIEGWSDKWSELDDALKQIATDNSINGTGFRSKANQDKLKSIIMDRFPDKATEHDPEWSSEGTSIPPALQQALPLVQLIPAVRDATEEGKPGKKTSFGLLLEEIVLPAVKSCEEYTKLIDAAETLRCRLKGEGVEQIQKVRSMADALTSSIKKVFPARVTIGMDPPDAEKVVGGNTTISLDDGVETCIKNQGHGLQRALVFAMLELIASMKAKGESSEETRSKVLLFEEPELFIHPQLMRILRDSLSEISKRDDWLVIATTHSPFLVDIGSDVRSLVLIQRPNPEDTPSRTQLDEDPLEGEERDRLRAVLNFHPTVCEALFAKKVVLVEGDTELAVLVQNDFVHPLCQLDASVVKNTSVISCGGKWTIPPIAKILVELGIQVRVVHDEDKKQRSDDMLSQVPAFDPYMANARISEIVGGSNIFVVSDTFEDVLWDIEQSPTSSKDKPFRAWKRVRELCEGKDNLDHVPKLKEILDFTFGE